MAVLKLLTNNMGDVKPPPTSFSGEVDAGRGSLPKEIEVF